MLGRVLASVALWSVLTQVAFAQNGREPAAYEFNLEGGLDFGTKYHEIGDDFPPQILTGGARAERPGAYAGLSAMRRLAGLRALIGLRLDGHAGTISNPGVSPDVDARTATAMLNYRAFLFDLQGDCDCPTWGNDPWFKKAFFVELGLGVGYQRYQATVSSQEDHDTFGGAYMARLGLSHRFSKQLDLYLAGGIHGLIADRAAFRLNDFGLRPTLGLTYRPRH